MIYKRRTESNELMALTSLNARMELSEENKLHFLNLKKGYEGEATFDSYVEKLQLNCLILNDLLLKSGSTTFQIDSYFVCSDKHRFYEIKNFDGDYYFEGDKFFYKNTRKEITNPLNQVSRSETLMRQLLHRLGYNVPVEGYLIFVNPSFTCYQAPLNKQIIFPNQIERHFNELKSVPLKLLKSHTRLAEKILSVQTDESRFNELPDYEFHLLRKGMLCKSCFNLSLRVEGRTCICRECGSEEKVDSAVLRSIEEFKLLFPGERITTKRIYEWCGVVSKRSIIRILTNNFKRVNERRWSYYE